LLRVVHSLYVASRTHLLPASAAANVDITPIVDLDTGGVIALQAVGDLHGGDGRDAERVYDDLVVVDEVGRCMGSSGSPT
jgi:hypothetical protein